jgi:hypothetical protein
VDDVTWAALTATLTVLGAVWTLHAFRHRGAASALRALGLTLLAPAAYLTGTLEMFSEIGSSISRWAVHLVFSPLVWLGVVLAGISVVCLGVSGALRERGRGRAVEAPQGKKQQDRGLPASRGPGRGEPAIDDELAEIEAILKKRGIT